MINGSEHIPKILKYLGKEYMVDEFGIELYFDVKDYEKIDGITTDFFMYRPQKPWNTINEYMILTPAMIKEIQNASLGPIVSIKKKPWKGADELITLESLKRFDCSFYDEKWNAKLRTILEYDSMTEGDSLRFFNHVAKSNLSVPVEFWPVLFVWLQDETNHHLGFKAVLQHLFGVDTQKQIRQENQVSDFEQFASILSDPFRLLVALTYDEAATIKGYQNDMAYYRSIGAGMERFIQKVITDEGWHFAKFASLAAKYYPNRIGEIDEILNDVFSLDGRPYQRTFFLDHDPSVEEQFDEQLRMDAIVTAKKAIVAKTKGYHRKPN